MNTPTIILLLLAVAAVILVVVLLARASSYAVHPEPVDPIELPEIDGKSVAERIGLAIQMQTLSNADQDKIDPQPFEGFRSLLRTLYPQLEEKLIRETINEHTLLYTWPGRDKSLDGVLFAAHQDVVPAPPENWTHPPFAGEVADGYVWGRGALDCKGSLMSILEAVNNLVKEGYQPERTLYLAFGHDEEVGGKYGATAVVRELQDRGVRLYFLMDEGGGVTEGVIDNVSAPVASIGIGEKGHITLKLRSTVQGGHSSTPPAQTAIGKLSLAITTLETNPFPQDLEVVQFMMSFLGDELPFSQRLALANPWLFGGTLKRKLAENPQLNAMTRTTTAPTIIHAGQASNILPPVAEAMVNFRVMAGETIEDVYTRVNDLVGDLVDVLPSRGETLRESDAWDPTPLADVYAPQYNLLEEMIRGSFPGAVVIPMMVTGGTDARQYAPICDNCFRFSPYRVNNDDMKSVHGIDERLSFENAATMVGFYQLLIRKVSSISAEGEAELNEEYGYEPADEPAPRAAQEYRPRAVDAPLPTKPMKAPKPEAIEPEVDSEVIEPEPEVEAVENVVEEIEQAEDAVRAISVEDLPPLPDDDEPLVVKPMKKK